MSIVSAVGSVLSEYEFVLLLTGDCVTVVVGTPVVDGIGGLSDFHINTAILMIIVIADYMREQFGAYTVLILYGYFGVQYMENYGMYIYLEIDRKCRLCIECCCIQLSFDTTNRYI